MKKYVELCFTTCESVKDKDQRSCSRRCHRSGTKDGSAYTIDWNHEPLPGLSREHVAKRPKKKQLKAFSSLHPRGGGEWGGVGRLSNSWGLRVLAELQVAALLSW